MVDIFTDRFEHYMDNIENTVNEFVIVVLSFGAIMATLYTVTNGAQYDWVSFGRILFPWVSMLALMIIARELWLLNTKVTHYLKEQSGE
jgi:hypothetical protein